MRIHLYVLMLSVRYVRMARTCLILLGRQLGEVFAVMPRALANL